MLGRGLCVSARFLVFGSWSVTVRDFSVACHQYQRELELQCQRDEHRIRQLQRTVRDLQASVEARASPDSERIREQQQGLEKTRQQLLWVAGLLTSFISQAVDRQVPWSTCAPQGSGRSRV